MKERENRLVKKTLEDIVCRLSTDLDGGFVGEPLSTARRSGDSDTEQMALRLLFQRC